MKFPNWSKFVGGIVGAILLSAFSSGLWEFLLKPVVLTSSNAMLNLVTFGFESFKDSLYQDVALGFRESASNELLVMFYWLLGVIFLGLVSWLRGKAKALFSEAKSRIDELEAIFKELDSLPAEGEKEETSLLPSKAVHKSIETTAKDLQDRVKAMLEKSQSEYKKYRPKLIHTINLTMFLVVIVFGAFWIGALRSIYINARIAEYEQLHSIISPFVIPQKRYLFESNFARIQSEADYKKLMSEMVAIASKERIDTSTFSSYK